jgi:hypothetical protein
VPSTVGSQAPVHSYKLVHSDRCEPHHFHHPSGSTRLERKLFPQSLACFGTYFQQLHRNLQNLVKDLPESIPEASEFDRLAVFGGNPKEFDDPALDADELWETTLNNVLKSTLGWGTEGNMDEIIRRGKWGLDGLVNFATYFVEERGVSGGLFEGKLTHLVTVSSKGKLKLNIIKGITHECMQGTSQPHHSTPPSAVAEIPQSTFSSCRTRTFQIAT